MSASFDPTSASAFKSWLCDWIVAELKIDRSVVESGQSLLSFGMDSVQAMTLVGDLESLLNLRLPPTLAWDYPDVNALSSHLAERAANARSRAGVGTVPV
jgi:acyl carrier protein